MAKSALSNGGQSSPPRANRGKFTVVEIDGYIAIARGERYLEDRPAREYWYSVSEIRVTDGNRDVIGHDMTSDNGVEWLTPLHGYRRIDMTGWSKWPERAIEVEIKAPRNGRQYGWKWQPGRQYDSRAISDGTFKDGWVKEQFPPCQNCSSVSVRIDGKVYGYTKYHDPSFAYVEDCDRCHAGGICDEKGVCSA